MRSTLLLTALLLVGTPSVATATCFIDCQATLMYSDCTTPPPGVWYAGDPLTFLGSCETCCSPPGGPVQCDPTTMDMAFLYVKMDGATLPGGFAQAGATCDDSGNMFLFTADSGPLTPGSYELIDDQSKLIMVQFEVVEKIEVVEEIVIVEEVADVVEAWDVVDVVEIIDFVDVVEIVDPIDLMATDSAVLGEIGEDALTGEETNSAPDTAPPQKDVAPDIGDAGYVVCGEKKDGGGGCAAGPAGVAPLWLLVMLGLIFSLRHRVPSALRAPPL